MSRYVDEPSSTGRCRKKRATVVAALFVVLVIWVVGTGCWPLVTWSTHEDIDINSGRVRRQRYLVGLCIHESIEPSTLTRLVEGELGEKPADWRRVTMYSSRVRVSPHYLYHGAVNQIRVLESIWDFRTFTPAAKRQAARDVLLLWQRGEGYWPVDYYLSELESISRPWDEDLEPIEVGDLPSPDSIESLVERADEDLTSAPR
jgi:hypothetical protein